MDSNGPQNSGEKPQSKPSGGSNSNSHSSHSRESNNNRNSSNHRSSTNDKSRNPSQGGKEKNNDNRRYQPRPEYRNNIYSSNRGSEDYKRNKNYNNKYTSDWNRRSNRSQNWHSSGPRYGNLSWQRNNPNQNQNQNLSNQPEHLQIVGEYIKDYVLQQLKNPNGQEFLDQSHGYQTRFDRSFEAGDTSNYTGGFTNDQGPRETNQEYRQGNHSSSKFSEPKNDSQKKGKPPKKNKPFSKPKEDKIPSRETRNIPSHKEPSNKSVGTSQKPSQVKNNRPKQHTPENQGDLNEHANIKDTSVECGERSIEKEKTFIENSQPKNATQTHQEFISLNEECSELENEPIPENQVTNDISDFANDYVPPEDDPHQGTPSQKTSPEIPNSEDLLLNIKSELPDASDSDFDIANCLNVDSNNRFPSISVVPLSKLLKSELLDLNRPDIVVPTTPVRGRPTLRPNLVQRRKNSTSEGSLSENLVQRVANMDKVGIKNVINNSGTKYDAALKIQARKKLREEIRKQLKSMNFTPPENSENSVLVPDEIVDSLNIPAVVLDEIRKAFGIVLIEDKNMAQEQKNSLPPTAEEAPPPPPASQPKDRPSKSPDLMSRLKMLTETKSQTEKMSPERPFVFTLNKHSKTKKTDNDVVLIESSSSSSSSSSSDSDSDSSSTSSNVSRTSSYKRRRRKKRILEANVVGNFEKLILPNLTEAQRRRYKDKYSKSTKGSLLYIHGICVRRSIQNNTPMDPKEKLKLKRNLSTADNAESLEFLMKAILSLFEHQKEKRRMSKEKSTATATNNRSNHSNPVSPTNKLTDSTCNQRNAGDNGRGMVAQSESANTAQGSSERQSTKVDKAPRPSPSEGANDANSAQGVSAVEKLVTLDTDSDSVLNGSTGKGNNLSCSPSSRLWKSPGEKKCIELEASSPMSSIGMLQPPFGSHSLDLDAISSHSSIGNEAVSSIREIDVKLMELHKRKMYIEEMILKLQKDKMEVDLWTMRLQNEKFILLNSALANASSTSSILAAPKIDKKAKPTAKRKPFSTPFSEKLRNRKKRCQRDILLEDTDNVISKLGEKVSDMAKLMFLPRQTRQSISVSDNQAEASKTDGEVKIEEPPKEEEESVKATLPQVDYTNVPNGNLEGWKLPITQIIVTGEAIVAASEDGNIYKFNIRTRALESKFSKHTEAITQIFTCPRENFVYTTSLDGFLKKTSIENFGLEIQSLNLQEPLQSIDIEWGTAYIGSRWGNIFTYDIKKNNLSETLLCSSESSIIAIKATKEGPRKILIVSSKGNQIHFRDAMSGLLLRSLDVPDNLHIYSILLDGGCIYCGTQRNEIHQYNFTTGGRLAIFHCGNGAVSMKLYKEKYIFVGCYDGFVYVLDKVTGCQIGRFPGSGKMILALEIAGDKLITSAKDNTMQIIDIPKYIVTKDKS